MSLLQLILWHYFFDSLHERTDMIKTDSQAIDYPYPTANTPPLTTQRALIVCGALRCVRPCDDDRDAKEDDCDDVFVKSYQFSRKQLRYAMILVLWETWALLSEDRNRLLRCASISGLEP